MRLPHSQFQRTGVDLVMTPMIDVVFLLLIFFVCTASFQIAEEDLPAGVATPRGGGSPEAVDVESEAERLVVRLDQTGGALRWAINQRPCGSLKEVQEKLAAVASIDATLPVILDIGSSVAIVHVVQLYDTCYLAGLHRIFFAASAPS